MLEKMKDAILLIHHKLSSSVSMDIYGNRANTQINGKKFPSHSLPRGYKCPVFLMPIAEDKYVNLSIGGVSEFSFLCCKNGKQ